MIKCRVFTIHICGYFTQFVPTTKWMEEEVILIVPDAVVKVTDLNGSGDHFHVRVVSEKFVGLRTLQRQKILLNHFKQYIPKTIHALDIQALTPEQANITENSVFNPHSQGQGIHNRVNRNS